MPISAYFATIVSQTSVAQYMHATDPLIVTIPHLRVNKINEAFAQWLSSKEPGPTKVMLPWVIGAGSSSGIAASPSGFAHILFLAFPDRIRAKDLMSANPAYISAISTSIIF